MEHQLPKPSPVPRILHYNPLLPLRARLHPAPYRAAPKFHLRIQKVVVQQVKVQQVKVQQVVVGVPFLLSH